MNAEILNHLRGLLVPPLPPELKKAEKTLLTQRQQNLFLVLKMEMDCKRQLLCFFVFSFKAEKHVSFSFVNYKRKFTKESLVKQVWH